MTWTPKKDVPPSPITSSMLDDMTEIDIPNKSLEHIISTPINTQFSNTKQCLQFANTSYSGHNEDLSTTKGRFLLRY